MYSQRIPTLLRTCLSLRYFQRYVVDTALELCRVGRIKPLLKLLEREERTSMELREILLSDILYCGNENVCMIDEFCILPHRGQRDLSRFMKIAIKQGNVAVLERMLITLGYNDPHYNPISACHHVITHAEPKDITENWVRILHFVLEHKEDVLQQIVNKHTRDIMIILRMMFEFRTGLRPKPIDLLYFSPKETVGIVQEIIPQLG